MVLVVRVVVVDSFLVTGLDGVVGSFRSNFLSV